MDVEHKCDSIVICLISICWCKSVYTKEGRWLHHYIFALRHFLITHPVKFQSHPCKKYENPSMMILFRSFIINFILSPFINIGAATVWSIVLGSHCIHMYPLVPVFEAFVITDMRTRVQCKNVNKLNKAIGSERRGKLISKTTSLQNFIIDEGNVNSENRENNE